MFIRKRCFQSTSCCLSLLFPGWSHKPCVVRTLSDILNGKNDVPERLSTLCKLIYCRTSGSDSVENSLNTFELFVTDSSLVNALRKTGKDDGNFGYVRIIAKKCHVFLEEMRRISAKFGTILHAKHLLLKGALLMWDVFILFQASIRVT